MTKMAVDSHHIYQHDTNTNLPTWEQLWPLSSYSALPECVTIPSRWSTNLSSLREQNWILDNNPAPNQFRQQPRFHTMAATTRFQPMLSHTLSLSRVSLIHELWARHKTTVAFLSFRFLSFFKTCFRSPVSKLSHPCTARSTHLPL